VKQAAAHNEPKYSAVRACVAALYQPVTAVRRADHLPLWKAWGVHVAAGVMTVVAVLVLKAWQMTDGPAHVVNVAGAFIVLLGDVIEELDRVSIWVAILFSVIFIELTWILSALITMSWSARDEPLHKSCGRALRRLCLLTPHAVTITLLFGGVMIGLERMIDPNDYSAYWIYESAQLLVAAAGCLWSLWVVLRVMGVLPGVAMSRWPARCMECGYELAGLRREQDCPECGRAVVGSLRDSTRPGIAPPYGRGWWLAQTYRAVRRPTTLGQRMHVLSPDTGHRRCLLITLVWLMLISPIGFGLLYVLAHIVEQMAGISSSLDWEELFHASATAGTMLGLALTAITTVAALGGAGLIGGVQGRRYGRNLMPAAIRAACYQSGFMVFWAAVCWCNLTFFAVCVVLELLPPIATRYNIMLEVLVFTWLGGVVALGLVIYLILIYRATKAARYANW
jgi:hypothetical protein